MIRPAPVRLLSASGQLGYGVLEAAFQRGIEHQPDMIGADMGSVDPGPAYLGTGLMATDPETTRRDLSLLLRGARELDIPLIIGTAGTAGATPHLDAVLAMIREIASDAGLSFRLASIRADIAKDRVLASLRAGQLSPLGAMAPVSEADILDSPHIVAQMDEAPITIALDGGADVVVAGRACDTAIYTAVALARGHDRGLATHAAKIIECASLCCDPGGRESMLATLDTNGFTLDCMNPGSSRDADVGPPPMPSTSRPTPIRFRSRLASSTCRRLATTRSTIIASGSRVHVGGMAHLL